MLAVRGVVGSAGFFVGVVVDFGAAVFSVDKFLLLGAEFELGGWAGDAAVVWVDGCVRAFVSDGFGFAFSLAANVFASGFADVSWLGDVDGV